MMKHLVLAAAGVLMAGGAAGAWAGYHHSVTAAAQINAQSSTATNMPGPKWGWGHHRSFILLNDAAKALNVSSSALRADLKAGDTLAQIASAHGSSGAALASTLEADVKASIQTAVQNGTLTSAQAAQITQHVPTMVEAFVNQTPNLTFGGGFRGHGNPIFGNVAVETATALNLPVSTIKADLKAGESLAAIANSTKGYSAAILETALEKDADTAIQNAVTQGKLTATEATRLQSHVTAMVTRLVTQTPGAMMHGPFRGQGFRMIGNLAKDAAAVLKLTPSQLRADLRSGESLATIAAKQNVTVSELTSTLTQDAEAAIQKAESNGMITAAQASTMESGLSTMITKIINSSPQQMMPPFQGGGFGMPGPWGTHSPNM